MEEKNIMRLCMRYSESCNSCPRNKKCDEELEKEKRGGSRDEKQRRTNKNNKKFSNGFRRKSRRNSW